MSSHPLLRTVSRWFLGAAGILWVTIAATLCGCSPISPVNGWAMNESGKGYYRRGDYSHARREFERALMDNPHKADYAYNVAAAMDQQGDHAAAEKMYRHALALDPGHQPSYHGLAALMMEEGRTEQANDLIGTWAATQPYSAEAATELGWLKGETGDLDGADRELRRALRQNPRNTKALAQLGKIHGKAGRRQDAAAEYARSLFVDPLQPETQAELASMEYGPYGSPALQMAGAMPQNDPMMANSPPFTMPSGQPQMAGTPADEWGLQRHAGMAELHGSRSEYSGLGIPGCGLGAVHLSGAVQHGTASGAVSGAVLPASAVVQQWHGTTDDDFDPDADEPDLPAAPDGATGFRDTDVQHRLR
jgi:Tfp pilus assembly protein PilF